MELLLSIIQLSLFVICFIGYSIRLFIFLFKKYKQNKIKKPKMNTEQVFNEINKVLNEIKEKQNLLESENK